MPQPGAKKPPKNSLAKLIEKYYADLADFTRQNVLFEMGTRHAFHRLLADAGKPHGWTLIAEQEKKVGGKTIRPDGTFKEEMNLVRGYWEAKDTGDNLDKESRRNAKRVTRSTTSFLRIRKPRCFTSTKSASSA
jgi:hypothetical protein